MKDIIDYGIIKGLYKLAKSYGMHNFAFVHYQSPLNNMTKVSHNLIFLLHVKFSTANMVYSLYAS